MGWEEPRMTRRKDGQDDKEQQQQQQRAQSTVNSPANIPPEFLRSVKD